MVVLCVYIYDVYDVWFVIGPILIFYILFESRLHLLSVCVCSYSLFLRCLFAFFLARELQKFLRLWEPNEHGSISVAFFFKNLRFESKHHTRLTSL